MGARPRRPAARRLAREVVATMAVYTHFGGMDEVERQLMRRGFAHFGSSSTAVASPAIPWRTG